MAEIVDSTVEHRGKPVEPDQGGEVIRAERKMKAILCLDLFTCLIVGFFDKAVTVYVLPQSEDEKEN